MNRSQAMEATARRCREKHFSLETERSYVGWVGRFCRWRRDHPGVNIGGFLSWLAVEKDPPVSAPTHGQALNAMVFFYREVLRRDPGKIDFTPAKRHEKAPDCLSAEECHRLFGQMRGVPQLQAQLMFGTGARVSEMLKLRIKDLDFAHGTITIRQGKGRKDRVVFLPRALRSQLEEQIEKANYWWRVDQEQGNPPPEIEPSLAKKLGKQVGEFAWFWLFPASKLSTDPRSGIVRRHHLTSRGIGKALAVAAGRAGLRRRVHPHVMRHSFATDMIRRGTDVRTLATLMGHKKISTTERYLHALPDVTVRAVSPLDADPSNVLQMPAPPREMPVAWRG